MTELSVERECVVNVTASSVEVYFDEWKHCNSIFLLYTQYTNLQKRTLFCLTRDYRA